VPGSQHREPRRRPQLARALRPFLLRRTYSLRCKCPAALPGRLVDLEKKAHLEEGGASVASFISGPAKLHLAKTIPPLRFRSAERILPGWSMACLRVA
jgi:hypothetical protein